MPINYKEISFEAAIEAYLIQLGGYQKRNATDYNKELALDPGVLLVFIKGSQPKEGAKFCKTYGPTVNRGREISNRF